MARTNTKRIDSAWIDDIVQLSVIDAPRQWAVTYQGRLIAGSKQYRNRTSREYIKTIFMNEASAYNLAARLNNLFGSEEFGYKELQ